MIQSSHNTEGRNHANSPFVEQSSFTGYDPYLHQTPPYYPMDYSSFYYGGMGSGGGGERQRGTEVQYGEGALFIPWVTPHPQLQGERAFQRGELDFPAGTGWRNTRATPPGFHDNYKVEQSQGNGGLRNRGSGQRRELEEAQALASGNAHRAQNMAVTHTPPEGTLPQGEGRMVRPGGKLVILRGLPGSGKSTMAR